MVEATAAEIGINPLLFKHLISPRSQQQQTPQLVEQISPPTTLSTPNSTISSLETPTKQEPTPVVEPMIEPPSVEKRIPRIRSSKEPLRISDQPEAAVPVRRSRRSLLTEQTPKKRVQSLRSRKVVKSKSRPRSKSDFCDKLLQNIEDLSKYHSYQTNSVECASEIIDLSRVSKKSHLDAFTYNSNSYFLMSWLGVARIFEFDDDAKSYNEVKRIPERYISLSPRIITSLHYSDSKLYIAYLWGQEDEFESGGNTKPFIEVRDLYGKLIKKPYYYDDIVKSITSRDQFITVVTASNVIHVHRKQDFDLFPLQLDMSSLNCGQIVDVSVRFLSWHCSTSLQIVVAVLNGIIVAQYSASTKLVIKQWYTLENDHMTASMIMFQDRIILHRNSPQASTTKAKLSCPSTIEIGYMKNFKSNNLTNDFFIHELSLQFKCQLLDVRLSGNQLFLFGLMEDYLGNESYQLGCLDLKTCRPLWIEHLNDVDRSCHILVNDRNVILVKKNQEHQCIVIDPQTQVECKDCKFHLLEKAQLNHGNHKSIFVDLKVHVNKDIVY